MHRSGAWREIDSKTCSPPVVMLCIVVIDKDRLCAQGKAGVPRPSADRINYQGWGFPTIWQVALKGTVRRSSFVSRYRSMTVADGFPEWQRPVREELSSKRSLPPRRKPHLWDSGHTVPKSNMSHRSASSRCGVSSW